MLRAAWGNPGPDAASSFQFARSSRKRELTMSFKRFLASSLLSVAVLFAMASTAVAITYQYTGNPFETVFAPYTTSMSCASV